MPLRKVAEQELAALFSVLAHPLRLGLVLALAEGERDVSTLVALTGAPQTAVSQALGRLRSARLVRERRDKRHVHYSLTLPALPQWLDGGYDLLAAETAHAASLHTAIASARRSLSSPSSTSSTSTSPPKKQSKKLKALRTARSR